MMKNQLAGLMKQAQQMQDNMKKAQEELANTEVEGQEGHDDTEEGKPDPGRFAQEVRRNGGQERVHWRE